MKLYELTNDYLALQEAIENGEIPEEALADTLEAITGSLEDKVDSIACILKGMDADIAAIKAEEDRLEARRQTKEAARDRLKQYLSDSLQRAGMDKLETARNRISFRKSEKVVIDENTLMVWALTYRDDLLTYTDPKPNLTAIKAAIKNGDEVFGASLCENRNIQIK